MTKLKLTKDDWVAAGFRALAEDGPDAVRIMPLARRLEATKGSFYWHFADLKAFVEAMMELWVLKVIEESFAEVQAEPDASSRLNKLVDVALASAPDEFGGQKIETAMRAWALYEPVVAATLTKIDALRLGFLEELAGDLGLKDPPTWAALFYGTYIGLDDLRSKDRKEIEAPFRLLKSLIRQS